MSTFQDRSVNWKNVPPRTITAGGVEFAYQAASAPAKNSWRDWRSRSESRDKKITIRALQAQLKALRSWGSKRPADLSRIHQPVLVANSDSDRMVPSINTYDLAQRLPNSELIIYPDSGHGAVFQFHADLVAKALEFLGREQRPATVDRQT